MKKRLGTVLLLALFVISSMMPTSAATAEIWNEARASHYFDAYMLGISAKGGGEMAVSFGVFGTDTMDKIGVYSLRIESEIAPNKWIEEFTVFRSCPDGFLLGIRLTRSMRWKSSQLTLYRQHIETDRKVLLSEYFATEIRKIFRICG